MITLIIIIYDKNFSCSRVEGFIGSGLLINPLRWIRTISLLYYKILIHNRIIKYLQYFHLIEWKLNLKSISKVIYKLSNSFNNVSEWNVESPVDPLFILFLLYNYYFHQIKTVLLNFKRLLLLFYIFHFVE